METKLRSQSVSDELRDYLKAYYDGFYAALGHNHAGVYSAVGHQHTSRQVIYFHGGGQAVPAGGTYYMVPSIPYLTTLNAVPWSVPGTMKNLHFRVNATQPASGSLVATVQKHLVDTSIAVTVPANSGPGVTYTNLTGSGIWTSGDLLCIKIVNYASAPSTTIIGVTLEFQPSTL